MLRTAPAGERRPCRTPAATAAAALVLLSAFGPQAVTGSGSAGTAANAAIAVQRPAALVSDAAGHTYSNRRIKVTSTADASAPKAAQEVLNRVVCDNKSNDRVVYTCQVTDISGADATTDGWMEAWDKNPPLQLPSDSQVKLAYDLLGDTYDFYLANFLDSLGRPYDLTDNIGLRDLQAWDPSDPNYAPVLSATVNSCGLNPNGDCQGDNAFWSSADGVNLGGGDMQIGAGLAGLSDVIAHELQHGVTASLAGLKYQGQSGAINESLSDIFGEALDHYRQARKGSPADDWTIGEGRQWQLTSDLSVPYLRSMKNPVGLPLVPDHDRDALFPLYDGQADSCKGWQPDKMSSPCWDTDPKNEDAGGVHSNSGVGNHLHYLMSQGGKFNGYTIAGMGEAAAMQLWWATLPRMRANETYYMLGRDLWAACVAIQSTASTQRTLPAGTCNATVRPALLATEIAARRITWSSSIPASVTSRSKLTLKARITDARRAGASAGLAGQTVVVQRLAGKTWATVASATTNSAGAVSRTFVAGKPGYYRYAVLGAGASPVVASRSVKVSLKR